MNIAQFEEYASERNMKLVGGAGAAMVQHNFSSFSPNVAMVRNEWRRVKDSIRPHFYGEMPSAVEVAFPNEKPSQVDYRRRVHTSPTKDKLWKAVTDVNRVIMSANFVMDYGDSMAAYFAQNKTPFNGYNLLGYLGVVLYPQRVLDANGWYGVLPDNLARMVLDADGNLVSAPTQTQSKVGVKVVYYPSENLIYWDSELMIFAEYKASGQTAMTTPESVEISAVLCYRILTKTTSFLLNPIGQTPAERYSEYYETPERNEIPAGILGGRWIPRISAKTGLDVSYYESDFSYAVPVMEDLNVVKNQHKAITCTSVFSTTIIREIPCKADGCRGGKVPKLNADGSQILDDFGNPKTSNCSHCNGTGRIDLSALNVIVAPKASSFDQDAKPIALSDYIHHDTPDVSAVQELGGQVDAATEQVNQALTILQQKVVGQSAESKDADMQDKQTFLANIAMDLARIAENILRWTAYIVLPNPNPAEVAQISVAAPKTFNIMTIEALRQMRDQNRKDKSLETRANETIKLVEKESDNPAQVRLYELLHEYTQNRSEALLEELNAWLDYGIIDKKQYLEAMFAGAEIRAALAENAQITKAVLFATLDKKFAGLAQKAELATQFEPRQTSSPAP